MAYTSNWTGGLDSQAVQLEIDDDYELKLGEQKPVVAITATAASKSVLLKLPAGETMTVINSGENTVTIANVESEDGTSLASGSVAFVFSKGADGATINTLYPQSGGGGGGGGAFTVKLTEDDQNNWSSDKTFAQIKAAVEGGQAVSALVYSGTDLICIAPLTWFDFSEGNGMVTFCAMTINQSNNRLGALYYYLEEDDSVTATPLYYTLTPSE